MIQEIKFKGTPYILVGEKDDPKSGAIATREAFKAFTPGYAVLHNGKVIRHNEVIGTIEDVEFLGEAKDVEYATREQVIGAMIDTLLGNRRAA